MVFSQIKTQENVNLNVLEMYFQIQYQNLVFFLVLQFLNFMPKNKIINVFKNVILGFTNIKYKEEFIQIGDVLKNARRGTFAMMGTCPVWRNVPVGLIVCQHCRDLVWKFVRVCQPLCTLLLRLRVHHVRPCAHRPTFGLCSPMALRHVCFTVLRECSVI